MAMTNADLRKMIVGNRGRVAETMPRLTVPDRLPQRCEPESRLPARNEFVAPRTIEIVWAPAAPAPTGRALRGLALLAKALAVPMLLAGGLYAEPVYACHKQKSHGMLYYGTTVQMCVGERMAQRAESVQAFVDRQIGAM